MHPPLKIINLIDSIDKVNFGIWNAALSTAEILKESYGYESEVWFPRSDTIPDLPCPHRMLNKLSTSEISSYIQNLKLKIDNCLIISHGCWRYATKWGYEFKKRGFKWIYVPHGMLEPWSLKQKFLQKKIYFHLLEKRLAQKADIVRAVGSPEYKNLKKVFPKTQLIANGIPKLDLPEKDWYSGKKTYLFMARLHNKKGILPLIEAWKNSPLMSNKECELLIAGPDDGELKNLQSIIKESQNIKYLGAVYGDDKNALLEKAHFYVLPSYSEGFPTSVLEAMHYGLIPLISKGCNFPEAFEKELGLKLSPKEYDIINALEASSKLDFGQAKIMGVNGQSFVLENYSLNKIAEQQHKLYQELLKGG